MIINSVIVAAAEPPASGSTVTIALTNPIHASSFRGCTISELFSEDLSDTGERLATIDSPTGSTTVSVPSGVFGIEVFCDSSFPGATPENATCSGGVSVLQTYEPGVVLFSVSGDGSIVLDGIDWRDD